MTKIETWMQNHATVVLSTNIEPFIFALQGQPYCIKPTVKNNV